MLQRDETDYEHGNGMTYNPNTQEIAIAGLFTNDPSDAGAIFIVDANTLHFKRKVQVETEVSISLASTMFRKRSICSDGKPHCRLCLLFYRQ
ncbi:MAG: hypothetical protein ACLT1I_12630 [Mediterraneibacter faecis]